MKTTANANDQQQQSWTQDALLIFQVWLLFVVSVRVCVSEPGRLTAELQNATGQQLCGKLTQRSHKEEEMQ